MKARTRIGRAIVKAARGAPRRERLYTIIVVNDKTGARTNMFNDPMTHREAEVVMTKLTPLTRFPHLRYMFIEKGSR